MGRPGNSREVLIAEALGDFAKLFDRLDSVAPTLEKTCVKLELTASKLQGSIEPFQARIVATANQNQDLAVKWFVEQVNLVGKKTLDEQIRAMQESARKIFNDEVVPPLNRVTSELRQAKLREKSREGWVTHAAVAITAACCTSMLTSHPAPEKVAEPQPIASAPTPNCVTESAARPEKARVRK